MRFSTDHRVFSSEKIITRNFLKNFYLLHGKQKRLESPIRVSSLYARNSCALKIQEKNPRPEVEEKRTSVKKCRAFFNEKQNQAKNSTRSPVFYGRKTKRNKTTSVGEEEDNDDGVTENTNSDRKYEYTKH